MKDDYASDVIIGIVVLYYGTNIGSTGGAVRKMVISHLTK